MGQDERQQDKKRYGELGITELELERKKMGNCVDDLENQKREGGERKVRVNVVQSSLGGDFKMVWQVLNGR